ncbi:MAG TPA: hypothetical protein DCZ71_07475 [Ruminococcus sp.]|nr:hypothetical protein [Ruminococcus sp.]
MIKAVLEQVTAMLRAYGMRDVYTAFDALPIEDKGRIFTVVGVESMKIDKPLYSLGAVYFPFSASVSIKITAPESADSGKLLEYYSTSAQPALLKNSDLCCSLTGLTIKHDTSLCRLVLRADHSVKGVTVAERSIT